MPQKFDFHLSSAPSPNARKLRYVIYFIGLSIFAFALSFSGHIAGEYFGFSMDVKIREASLEQIALFFITMLTLVVFWLTIFLYCARKIIQKAGI